MEETMSEERVEYDKKKKITRVYRSFSAAKTLVPTEELNRWASVVRSGRDDEGRPVKEVRYVFGDRETAEYNQQPLSFSGLTTFVGDGRREEQLGDGPDFSTREDFGIEPE
jgi:hypothetical protein